MKPIRPTLPSSDASWTISSAKPDQELLPNLPNSPSTKRLTQIHTPRLSRTLKTATVILPAAIGVRSFPSPCPHRRPNTSLVGEIPLLALNVDDTNAYQLFRFDRGCHASSCQSDERGRSVVREGRRRKLGYEGDGGSRVCPLTMRYRYKRAASPPPVLPSVALGCHPFPHNSRTGTSSRRTSSLFVAIVFDTLKRSAELSMSAPLAVGVPSASGDDGVDVRVPLERN